MINTLDIPGQNCTAVPVHIIFVFILSIHAFVKYQHFNFFKTATVFIVIHQNTNSDFAYTYTRILLVALLLASLR